MFSYEMLVNCENKLPEDFVPPSLAAPDIAFAADPSDEKRFLEVRAARHAKRLFDAAKAEPAEDWKKGSVCVDDDGNVYVGDCVNYCVRKITPDGTVTTLAGLAGNKGCIDGTGVQARFNGLYGMDCDAEGNIILTDVFEWKIRKITPDRKSVV